MASKYLIIDDSFRMSSSIEYHKELVPEKNTGTIHGGGRFFIVDDTKDVFLYDSSDDFGAATKEQILAALRESFLSPSLDGYSFYITHENSLAKAMKEQIPDFTYFA